MELAKDSLADIAEEARAFMTAFQSVELATARDGAVPVASYAPFALSQRGGFYVYLSELAAHTANVMAGNTVALLFIEPESDAANIFARRRLTMICQPTALERDTAAFNTAIETMVERFGETMEYLRKLRDFHAFELTPTHAGYVKGFAQAYEFPNADFDQIRHINDRGHDDS